MRRRSFRSPLLPFRVKTHNVRHAITLLGEREFRRWVAIVALVMIAEGKPAKLIRTALTRAYICEELARPLGLSRNSSELFLMGLLSTADGLLDRPMTQVLAELSLSAEIRTALSGAGGAFGNVYETLFAYEKADWNELSRIAKNSGYSEEPGLFCGGEHARDRAHVLMAASTRETKNNTEQALRRRRLTGNQATTPASLPILASRSRAS